MTAPDAETDGTHATGADGDGRVMSFGEHLEELRATLIRCLLWVGAGTIVCLVFADPLFRFATGPVETAFRSAGGELVTLSPAGRFLAYLKMSVAFGLFFTAPAVGWHLWRFVVHGLYRHEQRFVLLFVPVTVIFFLAGTAFAYFVMLPWGLRFLLSFGVEEIRNTIDIGNYVGFFLMISIVLGLVFELPLVMLGLARMGVADADTFRRYRRHAILGAFVLGAMLTPPDVFTQAMMAVPLFLLYQVGIWLAAAVTGESTFRAFAVRMVLWTTLICGSMVALTVWMPTIRAAWHERRVTAVTAPLDRDLSPAERQAREGVTESLLVLASLDHPPARALARAEAERLRDARDPRLRLDAARILLVLERTEAVDLLLEVAAGTDPAPAEQARAILRRLMGDALDRRLFTDQARSWWDEQRSELRLDNGRLVRRTDGDEDGGGEPSEEEDNQ